MTITLSPEDEQLVRERLDSGSFQTPEEVVHHALVADQQPNAPAPNKRKLTLSEFFLQSPLAGSELDLERSKDTGRNIEL
ncbi:MAG: hypothetical protein JO150_12845 [Acidobacteriaceae bacterium]|nr:hypothetical protein [Acidobacteriaceae bacterium]MBV9939386.1 hypothetical protein [Acidobacteriaceae bacterium]